MSQSRKQAVFNRSSLPGPSPLKARSIFQNERLCHMSFQSCCPFSISGPSGGGKAGRHCLGYWLASRCFRLASGPKAILATLRRCMVCRAGGWTCHSTAAWAPSPAGQLHGPPEVLLLLGQAALLLRPLQGCWSEPLDVRRSFHYQSHQQLP